MSEQKTNITPEYPFEFSVIMAAYNVEPFLAQAVDSLISQTFDFQRIQLILVDDGSTDATPSICDAYQRKYPDNILVIHKENGGVASARNAGLQLASGRYLNFMDSDDYFTNNTFEKVYHFFRQNDEIVDVVTIPLHFFDAQKGEHWQNSKFKKGTRILDLYWDYQSTLMFVNASFFVNRLKDEISFDSHLVCGEDIRMLLSVLIHKMKLGVVTGCKYMYRRRSVGEASLIQSSKKKYGWYFDYFTYLVDWAVNYYREHLGYLPAFLQYELLCDIQWRYREIYDMSDVLIPEEIELYKRRVASSLRYFDDKYILEQKMIWNEHKCYMLSQKYGCAPTITEREHNAIVHFGNTMINSMADQYSIIEFINLSATEVTIEGFTKIMGVDLEEPIEVYFNVNNQLIACDICSREDINEYRFGDLIYRGIQFKGTVSLKDQYSNYKIRLVIKYKNSYITKREIRYGKFAPIGKEYKNAYYYNENWAMQAINEMIFIFPCPNKKHRELETKLIKELWNKHTPATRKAIGVRLLYRMIRKFLKKKIWLISDRPTAAGDNGEAFFKYLSKQQNSEILPIYVLKEDSKDYQRVSQYGKVVAYLSWKHKLLHLLSSNIISSHADEYVYNPFFKNYALYRDILQKINFIFLQHGITQNNLSKWFNRYRINAKGFVASAIPESDSIVTGNYYYEEKSVWLSGFPRYDFLYHNEKRRIYIMPTWRAYLVTANQQTGERSLKSGFTNSTYYRIYSELLNNELLGQTAREHGYELHFICHPNMQESAEYFHSSNGTIIHQNIDSYTDLFAEGNLMVCDYSSVAFDFCYLRKPVIYCHVDYNEFFSGNHTTQEGYFNYETDGFGEVEYSVENTIQRIIEYIKADCHLKEKYRKRIDKFFAFNDQGNCERVYNKICALGKK